MASAFVLRIVVKRIYLKLLILSLGFILSAGCSVEAIEQAQDDVYKEIYDDVIDSQILYEEPVLLETEATQIRIVDEPITENQTLSSRFKERIKTTAQNVYELQIENTNVPSSLLEDTFTWDFEKGPVEKLHVWGVLQTNSNFEFYEDGDTNQKFKVGLINMLFDGKFRGGNEAFRLMLDPTPQSQTGFWHMFVQDAYIQTKRIPHHTVLFGNSRPGVGIEGAQSPYTLPLINRSQISRHFANARKAGIRVKGDYSLIEYDFGGYSSDTYFTEFMPGVEFNGWVNAKPLGKTDGRYGKVVLGGGIATGQRNSSDFFVAGANLGYEYKKFWMRAEYANADGSNGSTGFSSRQREGWYVTLGYHLTKKLELIARYDEFDPDKKISNDHRREYTAGINYYIKGQALKLVLNYIYVQTQNQSDAHRLLFATQIAL